MIDIKKIIQHLKDRGLGVLITDHNVRETLDVCEKAYIVSHGKMIAEGAPTTYWPTNRSSASIWAINSVYSKGHLFISCDDCLAEHKDIPT